MFVPQPNCKVLVYFMKSGIPYFDNKLEIIPETFFEHNGLASKTAGDVASVIEVLASVGVDYQKLTQENLDDLVLSLTYAPSPAVAAALVSRVGPRVMSLIWSLFQFDYMNENILGVLAAITKAENYTKFHPHEGQMAFIKGFVQNPLAVLSAVILSRKEPLSAIPQKYGIIADTPFFKDALKRVFACAPPDFIRENHFLIDVIFKDGDIPIVVLIRYLDVIPPEELSSEICVLITEKLGDPPDGEFWKNYPPNIGQKIINWNKIYKLTQAYSSDSKKYKFFGKYSHKLADTQFNPEARIVKLLFGQFTVIDDLSNENEFIFCSDPKASPQLKSLKKMGSLPTAKDYIVKGTQADYFKIELSGFNKEYANEMFDMLLDM